MTKHHKKFSSALCALIALAFTHSYSSLVLAQSAVDEAPPTVEQQLEEQESLDEQEYSNEPQEPEADKPSDKKSDNPQDSDGEADDEKTDPDQRIDGINEEKLDNTNSIRSRIASSGRYSKSANDFVSVFEPVVLSASESTVRVMGGRRQVAMGTIVDSDGFILTKASELRGDLTCKLSNGESLPAVVFGVDPTTDLALLKIDAKDLPVVQWSEQPTPETGRWVATPNNDREPLAIGVVSVNERKIPPSSPFIGIQMLPTSDDSGARINRVISGTPADRSGLQVNDIIFKLDDTEISDPALLQEALGQYSIGDIVKVTVRRGSKKVTIAMTLADRQNASPEFDRNNQQNQMGSTISKKRRRDFPLAFQHDSMLEANYCGGPIVDLDGRVVGINIARAGRVSSLALPESVVLPVIKQLMTGEYSPAVVNAAKIEKIKLALKELDERMDSLPALTETLDQKLKISDARKEELERMFKDIESRLKSIQAKADSERDELDELKAQLKRATSSKRRLEREFKKLTTGSR